MGSKGKEKLKWESNRKQSIEDKHHDAGLHDNHELTSSTELP